MPKLFAGIARRDLTPALGTQLFGYPQERLATEVADALNATALVLRSGETTAALVSLDWGCIDEEETAAIRAQVEAATDIPARNITLHATHTHSGPCTTTAWGWSQKDVAYLESVRGFIVQAVVEAQRVLKPVKIAIGATPTDIGINRREVAVDGSAGGEGFNEWGARDRDMTLVRFEGEDGVVALLVHANAHPTSRGTDPAISRDWPGVMMDRLESVTKAPVLFINGAFGDVAPRTTCGGYCGDGAPGANEIGLRAAGDAIRVWRAMKDFRDVELRVLSGKFELPHAPLPSLKETEKEIQARIGDANAFGVAACEYSYWNTVGQAHREPPQASRTFAQTLTSLGPIVIVPFAGEIFSEIALRLKKASPFAFTLCAGTTNGSHGYYPTREARGRGGYEIWVGRAFITYQLANNVDDVLVRENVRLLRELGERDD